MLDIKRDIEAKKLKNTNLIKQNNIKTNHLNEKMAKLVQTIQSEIETKNSWIERFEKEQATTSELSAKLLSEQSKVKDKELEIKDYEIKYQMLVLSYDNLEVTNQQTQHRANEYLNWYENTKRELQTMTAVNETLKIEQKDTVKHYELDIKKIKANLHHELDQIIMTSEDLTETINQKVKKIDSLNKFIRYLEGTIVETHQLLEIKEKEITKQKNYVESLQAEIEKYQ